MTDDVSEVKRRINIVDLVSSYVPLKKAGASWKGLCPFHQEKTPSFTVNPERQTYKCFGCAEGGDVLDFVMKMEHLTFPEALQLLADRVGVILDRRKTPTEYAQEKDEKSRLYALNRVSAEVFHRILTDHPAGAAARDYLKSRGLTDQTIADFRLGLAPAVARGVPTPLEKFLTGRGFTPSERTTAGSPERFRNRLMFPLFDTLGNVIGFTGRALDPADQPKYLNTPETPVFKKSRILYPLDRARDTIKQTGRVVVVEGQMDVLLSHQLGVKDVVATSGTALTSDHLEILARYTPKIVFAFDNDPAGVEATRKAILLAYDLELEPHVVALPPEFKDVGELALAAPETWSALVEAARPAFVWQIAAARAATSDHTSATGKKAIAKLTLPVLGRIRDPIERTHYLQFLARELAVPERTILDALDRVTQKTATAEAGSRYGGRDRRQETEAAPATGKTERRSSDELLVGLLIAFPEHLTQVLPKLQPTDIPTDSRPGHLVKTLSTWYTADKPIDRAPVWEAVRAELDRATAAWLESLVAEIEHDHAGADAATIRTEIDAHLGRIRAGQRETLKSDVASRIAAAESSGDRAAVKKLLEELQTVLKENPKSEIRNPKSL